MAQTGYTPILLYSSTTAAQAPAAGNLTNSTFGSELAINITDGKLFYKDNANAVQVIAWKTTPTTAGGTGLTSYTAGDLPYYATGTTLSKLAIGSNGQILTSTGTAPQWTTLSGVAVTTFSAGTTGFTPSVATSGAITLAGTLATTNGGTGLTSFTADRVFYASSTSAIGSSANLTFNGTTLTANDITDSSLTATRVIYAGTGGNLVDSANLTFNGTTLTSSGYSTSGNLTFTGAAARIIADFSNATGTNRAAFQDSTTNANTQVNALTNGTGTETAFVAYAGSAITNVSRLRVGANSAAGVAFIESSRVGSGAFLPLTFSTNNTEYLRLDTSGNFGVNNNNPGKTLDLIGQFRVRSSATGAYALVEYGASSTGTNNWHVGTEGDGTFRWYNGTFGAGTLRMSIASGGDLTLQSGNVVIGTSGKGIDFSATAGTGTSELLADYEEGTWTPTATSGSGTITSYTSSGYYTKVGRIVHLTAIITLTNVGTAGGNLIVTNLPFSLVANFSLPGLCRESAVTGVAYFPFFNGTGQINVQSSAGGNIVWTNNYAYTINITYLTT